MKNFILLILLVMAADSVAQTVYGYVSDAQTGERLPQALIYNSATKATTLTNSYGYYSLSHTAQGDTFVVRYCR